jgi:hypothetical protein
LLTRNELVSKAACCRRGLLRLHRFFSRARRGRSGVLLLSLRCSGRYGMSRSLVTDGAQH